MADSRGNDIGEVNVDSNTFSTLLINGNNRELDSDTDIVNVESTTTVTLQNFDAGGDGDGDGDGYEVNIILNEQDAAINANIILRNIDDADVFVGVDDSADGSAADDVLTVTFDGLQNTDGEMDFYTTDVETFNVIVASDSELEQIGNYYNNDGSDMGDTTVNLTANADLDVAFWDLNDDDNTSNTTFNITGAGDVTIDDLDDGGTKTTVAAATATGNLTILQIDEDAVSVTTGSGDDSIGIENAATLVSLGEGTDKLFVDDLMELNTEEDAFDADFDGGAGDADVFEISAANAILSEAELNDDVTDFTDAVKNFEILSLVEVDTGAVDATLYDINDVILDGAGAGFTLTVEDKAMVTVTDDATDLTIVVDGADDDDSASLTLTINGEDGVVAAITVAEVETINFVSSASDPDGGSNDVALTAEETVTLNISGVEALDFTGSIFADIETVAAAGFNAGLTIDVSAALQDVAITTGAGADVVVGSDFADTISVGNGGNVVTGGLGIDTITFGDGVTEDDVDSAVYTVVGDSQGVTVDVINGFQVDVQSTDDINGDNRVDADDVINDVLDLSAVGLLTGDAFYSGEADGYGAVLTSLVGLGDSQAVLDNSTSILYVDVNGDALLTNLDMAIKLAGVEELSAR